MDAEVVRIECAGGQVALVDRATDELLSLSSLAWHVHGGGRRRSVYACHATWHRGRARHVPMHHYVLPARPGLDVDHANGDSLDNRRENLRHLTHRANIRRSKRGLSRMHSRLR